MSNVNEVVHFQSKSWPLLLPKTYHFKGKTYLDPSFNRWSCWNKVQKEQYALSLITGKAPSPIIFANLQECLELSVPDSEDYIYFKNLIDQGYEYIAIDGNNRTITIDEYLNDMVSIPHGKYEFSTGTIVIHKNNDLFSSHPERLKQYIEDHVTFNAIEYCMATKSAISSCFININDGMPLNAQEKRNAILVNFAKEVRALRESYQDAYKNIYKKGNKRYCMDEHIVTLAVLYAHGPDHTISKSELNNAYEENSLAYKQLMLGGKKAIQKTLGLIIDFDNGGIRKPSIVNLFMLVRYIYLNKGKILNNSEFYNWFVSTENVRLADPTIVYTNATKGKSFTYKGVCNGTDKVDLSARYEMLLRDLESIPAGLVAILDPIRNFTDNQKYRAWSKQNGVCAVTGETIPESEIYNGELWEADHIKPWASGGKTTQENCQLIKRSANRAKSDKFFEPLEV